MPHFPRSILLALCCSCSGGSVVAGEEATADPTSSSEFLRFLKRGDSGADLETAVTTYEDEQGRRVDLVAAVHIADTSYYELLNRLFKSYDAVLYELVVPKDHKGKTPDFSQRKEAPLRNESAVGLLQRSMKQILDLDFQLDAVDYTPRNFVHADLDIETFLEKQDEAGESLFTLMLGAMMQEFSRTSSNPEEAAATNLSMLLAVISSERSFALKYVLGEQFGEFERIAAGFGGKNGSVLLEGRNEAALAVLEDELAAGKKKLAIFYGAAHMPDLEAHLTGDLGFEKQREHWLQAWKIRRPGE